MTIDEFLEAVKNLKCKWFLRENQIRTRTAAGYPMCPIVAVRGKGLNHNVLSKIGPALGLNAKDIVAIMEAADVGLGSTWVSPGPEWRTLRKRLLKATGLKEKENVNG